MDTGDYDLSKLSMDAVDARLDDIEEMLLTFLDDIPCMESIGDEACVDRDADDPCPSCIAYNTIDRAYDQVLKIKEEYDRFLARPSKPLLKLV